ncbi:hypothetical protein ABFS82_08G032500 [Erythranthe guttata]
MNLHPLSMVVLFLFVLIKFTSAIGDPPHLTGDVSINCGSIGTSAANNGGEWIGDIQPKSSFLLQVKGSSTTSTVVHNLISADPVPHKTARISQSQFSYAFQVSPGQKILRLHFNPTSYKGFKGYKDLFTVEAGPFTLLSNFSASLTADALGVDSFVKEFCLNVQENQHLNIIFFPESSQSLDTYAFINGIEIFSVPASLSYFEGGDVGLQLVGEKSTVYIDSSIALEIIHQVEIKKNHVQSAEYSDGTFPKWANRNAKIRNNNTWKMPVDVGFKYLIRVHFSELGLKVAGAGDNKFKVLINEMIARTYIDRVQERDGNSTPWHRDYTVMVRGKKKEGKRDILISLQSHDDLIDDRALLSGFEIFKLSNSANSLASPNPLPLTRDSPFHTVQIVFLVLFQKNAVADIAIAIISFVCIIVHKWRQIQESNITEEENKPKPKPSARAERICRCFSLDEIQLATKNFSDALIIGRGGFGKVYKGHIDKEQTTVAVKRLKSSSKQGVHEFLTEIETLSELRHANLVPLIGYCNEYREMILVYEYMPRGTLANHIYKLAREDNMCSSLTWKQLLDICIGAGRGLDYLHTGHGIIHRDVKATNILLDENLIAKVSDFGLAKPENRSKLQSYVSTNVKGTFGYLDPNYFRTRKLTRKSDTYAFGVVLLEVLCGRSVGDLIVTEKEQVLTTWARDKIDMGEADQIVSTSLREEISPNSLKTFVGVAQRCLSDKPKNRPTMSQVVSQLELAVEQQEINNDKDGLSVQTGQPTIFSTVVQNFTLYPKEHTNSNVAIVQLPNSDDKDGHSVQGQPPIFSTAVQNFTPPPHEQTNSNVVSARLPNNDNNYGPPVETGQPPIFFTAVQNITPPPHEQINSNVVSAQLSNNDNKDGPSIQTRQLPIFPIAVQNYTSPLQEQTNSNAVTAQLALKKNELQSLSAEFDRGTTTCANNESCSTTRTMRSHPELCTHFWLEEIKTATDNFDESSIIGRGEFFDVHIGIIDGVDADGTATTSAVAIKRLNRPSNSGVRKFLEKIEMLSKIKHLHLVSLIGYCHENGEMILVYNYVAHGSLHDHLYNSENYQLKWKQRLQICIGAAIGLNYLHTGNEYPIMHRHINSTNIMLDEKLVPKVSVGPTTEDFERETYGVYYLGVVLFEVLFAKPGEQINLAKWAKFCYSKWTLEQHIDSNLHGQIAPECLSKFVETALACVRERESERPSMIDVVRSLEMSMQLQEATGGRSPRPATSCFSE